MHCSLPHATMNQLNLDEMQYRHRLVDLAQLQMDYRQDAAHSDRLRSQKRFAAVAKTQTRLWATRYAETLARPTRWQ